MILGMVDELVNKAISDRGRILADRQMNIEHNVFESFEKGKREPIGTVKNGRRKVAEGKWVPVSERKMPPTSPKPEPKSKKKDSGAKSDKFKMPTHMSRHHIGTLRHIKTLTSKGKYSEAHRLAEGLPDEVKHEIPIKVWEKMVAENHKETIASEKEERKVKSVDSKTKPQKPK